MMHNVWKSFPPSRVKLIHSSSMIAYHARIIFLILRHFIRPCSGRSTSVSWNFLAAGYRRNGNSMYDMRCETCSECRSIRLHPDEFIPNRNQKRCIKKNMDVEVIIDAMRVDNERLELCDKFLSKRYPQKKNTAWGYYSCFFSMK